MSSINSYDPVQALPPPPPVEDSIEQDPNLYGPQLPSANELEPVVDASDATSPADTAQDNPAKISADNHPVASLDQWKSPQNEVEINASRTSENASTENDQTANQQPDATKTLNDSLSAAESKVNNFSQQYNKDAEGKAPIQKAMDEGRKVFNEGYGDDQFKNIGNTQKSLSDLRQQVQSGTISDVDAAARLNNINTQFDSEKARVTDAQGENQKLGKVVNSVARTGTVISAGVAGTVAGGGVNLATGFAAAAGAGAGYDLISQAAFTGSQGNRFVDKQIQEDVTSVGTIAGRAIKQQVVTLSDFGQGVVGSTSDGINGAFAGKGVANGLANAATQTATNAGRIAMGVTAVKTTLPLAAGQTGANAVTQGANTALNRNLTDAQKSAQYTQIAMNVPVQLVSNLSSGFAGGAAQFSNKAITTVAQVSVNATANVTQTAVQKVLNGEKMDKYDFAEGVLNAGVTHLASNAGQGVAGKGGDLQKSDTNSISSIEKMAATTSAAEIKGAGESTQGSAPESKSVTYKDGARVEYKQIDNDAVQRQLANYDDERVGDLIGQHSSSAEQHMADGTPYKVIPVSGKDKTIPSLGEMQVLSETLASSGAKGVEIGLATRIGNPNDVVMIVGTENRLPVPDGYRLAAHTHPGNSAPSPEDFNFSKKPLVIPQDGNNVMMGTRVSGFEATPVYGKGNATQGQKAGVVKTITVGELAKIRGDVALNQKLLSGTASSQKALPSSQMRTMQMAKDALKLANPSKRDVAFAYGRDVVTGATAQEVNLRQRLAEIGNSDLANRILGLPQAQIDMYSDMTKGVGTHAEVRVFDKLLQAGSKPENIEIAVLRPHSGEDFIMCPDCSQIIQGPDAITGRKFITPPPN